MKFLDLGERRRRSLTSIGRTLGMTQRVIDEHLEVANLRTKGGFLAARAAMYRDLRVRLGGMN